MYFAIRAGRSIPHAAAARQWAMFCAAPVGYETYGERRAVRLLERRRAAGDCWPSRLWVRYVKIMTPEEALALYESKFWETMPYADRAKSQLFEDRLCMPFDVYHEAVEKTLGRPVLTHELG